MDSGSLQNASTYLNNLLLARGLLRNGKSIEFACPKRGGGGTDDTMAKIINLVHDLVIRRDRDAEQRESLATNIRNLRTEDAQRSGEIERLQTKNAELLRNKALADGQRRLLEASARKAEASARELKEQMAKMKSTLDQVRAKCVNDIRKRDIELEKLKKHVTGMQRGATHSNGMKIVQLNPQPPLPRNAREFRSGVPVDDVNWSLEKETNDFLAVLVNETSTENVALRHIVGETMNTLKDLTGLDQTTEKPQFDPEIGIPGQYKQSRANTQSHPQESLIPCQDLAEQMDVVLGHCRAILKDPSFVSIEEVQIREDEIIKLREGWDKMASRWKDAVAMMDTWRKRMLEGGNTIDLHELSSLGLDKSIAVMPDHQAAVCADQSSTAMFDEELEAVTEEMEESDDEGQDHMEHEIEIESALRPPPKRLASSPARRGVRLPLPVTAFHEIGGNAQRKQSSSSRSTFTNSSADSGIGSLDGSFDSDMLLGKSSSGTPSRVSSPCSCSCVLLTAVAETKGISAYVSGRKASSYRS
jgi:Afadin- and alpha -actinin-Binding